MLSALRFVTGCGGPGNMIGGIVLTGLPQGMKFETDPQLHILYIHMFAASVSFFLCIPFPLD